MIRDAENEDITITVVLKNGETYEDKDIPSLPNGKQETCVTFWIDDKTLRAYSLSEVEYFQYNIK